MVKKAIRDHSYGQDEQVILDSISSLKVQKIGSVRSKKLIKQICHRVIPLVESRNLIYVDPNEIKSRAKEIKNTTNRRRHVKEIHELDYQLVWEESNLLRQHFSTHSFTSGKIQGYFFKDPSSRSILAIVYIHGDDPDKEYILLDSHIAKYPLWADLLITELRKKYKETWKKTHSI